MPMPQADHRPLSTSAKANSSTLLVVDDDRLIVATVAQRLRSAGYRVLEAFDGPTALNLCASAHPDLAILDYLMPGMSGAEVARELSLSSAIPIIFLSAYSDETMVSDAIGSGALTYVVKPIDTEQLLPIVRTALRRGREIAALHAQNEQLRTQLAGDQNVSTAVGLLMAKLKIDRREALERLRQKARGRRVKLEHVAQEFLRSCDESHRLLQDFSTPNSRPKAPEDDPH